MSPKRNQQDRFPTPLMVKVVNRILEASRVAPIVLRSEDDDGGRRTDELAPGNNSGILVVLRAF